MGSVRLQRMIDAYGKKIVFKQKKFLNRQSRVLKENEDAVTIEINPKFNASLASGSVHATTHMAEIIKARRVSQLLAEKEGYPLMRYCGFSVTSDFIQALNIAEDEHTVRILESKLMPKVVSSLERSMLMLQHVVANNIMEADFGYDVARRFYSSDKPNLMIGLASEVNRLITRADMSEDLATSQFLKRLSIGSAMVFLAENFIYQDEEVRDAMLGCLSFPVRENFFDFVRAANVALPRKAFASQDFRRTFFCRERYLETASGIQKFFGRGEFLEMDVADQVTFDNRIGLKALRLLDMHCDEPTEEGLDDLLTALDLLVRIQTIDVRKQVQEAYDLCVKIESSKPPYEDSKQFVVARLILRAKQMETRWAEYFLTEAVRKMGDIRNRRQDPEL